MLGVYFTLLLSSCWLSYAEPVPASAVTLAKPAIPTTFPTGKGKVLRNSTMRVGKGQKFDGGMKIYDRSPSTCKGQQEGGDKETIFLLEAGASLSNVIIGPNNGEGVHCLGTCTLTNIWWLDVCEDAATFKQTSGTSIINGGGARKAADKVFQHNGGGTVHIKNFYAEDIGKLYRSCGNCKTQHKRSVIVENVIVNKVKAGAVGLNGNLGDKGTIRNTCVKGGDICHLFKGTQGGGKPTQTAKEPDGKTCVTQSVSKTC